ncbi:MAG: hypothetical protein FWG93_01565 [Oscillospiraceae bacterium]|nr:hypothetical protein [Oscillospiraceae bacterium]
MQNEMQGETRQKPKKTKDEILELVVVILLGVTAVLTAWASWIGGLHGSNQAANYTTSNDLASKGGAEYNAGVQLLMQDMVLYNNVFSLLIDMHFAESEGDVSGAEKAEWKIEQLAESMSPELEDAFEWSLEETEARGESVSPFEKEGFVETYFADAYELLEESDDLLQKGNSDNANADAFALVTVLYSVVLFMLGIAGTFKNYTNKKTIIIISCAAFLLASIYMLTIPMPRDFSLMSFFSR